VIINWLDDAVHDLQSLRFYIGRDNSVAANQMIERLLKAVNLLKDHPQIGRPGRILDTRELIITGTPYFIPYRVKNNNIEILRVFHCARKWPEQTIEQEKIIEEFQIL